MKRILTLLLSLLLSPLLAETVGEIEYDFPFSTHGWRVEKKQRTIEEENCTAISHLYNLEKKESNEVFMAIFYNKQIPGAQCSDMTPEMLQEILQPHFQRGQVHVAILEKETHSILYEWDVKDDRQEFAHGWTRQFITKNGGGFLDFGIYMITPSKNIDHLRSIWMKSLKEAKSL